MNMCYTLHICARCGAECQCGTYTWACPWRNDDEDQMCSECMRQVTQEMEEFEREYEDRAR
jgi:hypothetical protein